MGFEPRRIHPDPALRDAAGILANLAKHQSSNLINSKFGITMFTDPSPNLLRPVNSDEFLPTISLWTTLGGLFLVGTVGAVFTLAAVIKYKVAVKAPATVRPTGETQIVQAATEGTVISILVKENQVVKQGDAIATIDNSQQKTKRSQLQGNIQNNQLKLTQIAAQLSSAKEQRDSESSLMNRTIAEANADFRRNQREYRERQITTQTQVLEAEAEKGISKRGTEAISAARQHGGDCSATN